MRSVIAQKPHIGKIVQPVGIVYHHRVGWAIAKGQIFLEDLLDALLVELDILI